VCESGPGASSFVRVTLRAMRSPRRTFAAPFVITMVGAAGSTGFTSCNPPRQTDPDPVIATGPPPDPGSETTTDPAPPQPGETRWSVYKQGADCFATVAVDCPEPASPGAPVPTCNPPPPMKYTCPDGLAMDRPIEIAQWPNATTCHVVPEPMNCPPNVACNPPPLRTVACPTP
jgi:hypothetical protein